MPHSFTCTWFFVKIVTVVIRYIRSKHSMGEPIAAIDDAR